MTSLNPGFPVLAVLTAVLAAPAMAEEAPKFETDVLPVFTKYCFTCHGQSAPKLGLDLRTAAGTLRGSHNGPVIEKGSPEKSLLWQKVSTHAMPPPVYKQTLPDAQIEIIRRWIAAGAPADAKAAATGPAGEQRARFEKTIQPILSARCVGCHGPGKPMAGLDLRSEAALLKGSLGGPVVVEGFSEKSLLVRKIASHAMPPPGAGKPLTDAEIASVREWIDRGHLSDAVEMESAIDRPFTTAEAPPITAADRQFWSFRKPLAAPTPKVRSTDRVRSPIDAFVLAKLEAEGLHFSPDASNLTLLRRAFFDLTGLPPGPEDVRAFLADTKPGAYERLIDRLLASPRYGERWGRHWLDAAGYVDTTGKDFRPDATELADGMWRYRDYVIRSVNDDKPWNRFLSEQIAGDEMVDWRSAKHLTPEMVELLTATGYMRNVLDITAEDISNLPVERYETLFKVVEKIGNSALGLTVQCARCHTHKFDPIPQRDYYRLLAIFSTSYNPADWLQPQNRHLWAVSKDDKEEIDRYNKEIDQTVGKLKEQLATLRKPYEERLLAGKLATLPEAIREDAKQSLNTPREKRNEVQKYLAAKFGGTLQPAPAEIAKSLTETDRATAGKLEGQIARWNGFRRELPKLQALWDVGKPPLARLLQRGNADAPGPKVIPGYPEALCADGRTDAMHAAGAKGQTSGLRLAFAEWLTSRDNPLAARVIVNRMWQHHFGAGIVATPDNFGKMGAPPVNQPLLDWLAVDFMEHGWSAKRLHRQIMLSTVYRQSARSGSEPWMAKAKTLDPENRWLWRMNLRRVDAEALRDAVLAVAGRLDTKMGGPPVPLEALSSGLLTESPKAPESDRRRRSVYLTARRTYPLTFLGLFDFPVMDTSCTRRSPSATPLQSLALMNDRFILDNAVSIAERVDEFAGKSAPAAKRIGQAYLLELAREPSPAEVRRGEEYLGRQESIYANANLPTAEAASRAFADLVHALMSSNEFLYVD